MALIERNSKSSLYKGLSSFWLKYFKDSDQLNAIYAGAESLFGQVYLDMMEVILSKSLTNIPVFKKEEWQMLVLRQAELAFDDAIAAFDTLEVGPVTFTITADKVDPTLDDVYVSFVDVASIREADKPFFPTVGIYNSEVTGKTNNAKNWTVVVPSNETIVDAIAKAKSRVISNQAIVGLDVGADATFTLSYDEGDTEITVTLTAAEQAGLGSTSDLVNLLITKINKPEIDVSIQAGYLIIETNDLKSLRVISGNQEAEDLLFIRPFNILIDVTVPIDVEATLLWEYSYYVQLFTQGFKQAGTEYRFPLGTTDEASLIREVKYVFNTIYDPSVIMEQSTDFRVENGFIYFKDNPFDLTNVAFRVINGEKELGFWMGDVLYDNTLLYERYGYRFTEQRPASEDYKLFLRGIIFYYTNGPDLDSITSALNLVAGIPVALENGEIVVDIQTNLIITDQNEYQIPPETNPVVAIGDVLSAFQYLTDAFTVEDYIVNPTWFANLSVPDTLMPGATIQERQLISSVEVPNIGEGGYIVGDSDPSGLVLTTDPIEPYGPVGAEYQLGSDAFFIVEIPSVGVSIPTLIPYEYTTGFTALSEIADIITKATSQVSGAPIIGTTLDYDATFDFNGTTITVPAGSYANSQAIIGVIDPQLPTNNEARLTPLGDSILFLNPDGETISIDNCSATAQTILGIQGVRSFQGIVATADADVLVFTNVSEAAGSLFRIVEIPNYTMTTWSMQPFRPGSGEMVGEDGQANLTYQIFDEILKYNTFKVSFNLANISVETDLNDLINIVLVGKPKYVTPIVSPIIDFTGDDADIMEHNPLEISPDDFGTFAPIDPTIAEFYDTIHQKYANMVFNVLDDPNRIRVAYEEGQNAYFATLKNPGLDIQFNSGLSTFRLDSKEGQAFDRDFHRISVGIENHLPPLEAGIFGSPGVYNYGVQTQGAPSPFETVERAGLGAHNIGIYTIDKTWVHGEILAEIDPRATHMFLMDETRPTKLKDIGAGPGDFLSLRFWPDAANNGKFPIFNISYNVTTPFGKADIVWFGNPNAVVDNIPSGKDEYDGSSYSFSFNSGNVNKLWFITLPEPVIPFSQALNQVLNAIGDDKAVFPFTLSLLGSDSPWDLRDPLQPKTYFTNKDPLHPDAFLGERHQMSAEWYRCFLVGEDHLDPFTSTTIPYLINPLDRTICPSDHIKRDDAFMVGFNDPVVGNTIKIGTNYLYNGGELSTDEALQINQGDFITPSIPGYAEYLP